MWVSPPSELSLSAKEAHVWLADLNLDPATLDTLWNLLASDEKERAQKFKFARDRRHFIAARGILRTLLSRYLPYPPREITFQYTSHGKPFFSPGNPLQFNLSHAGGKALIGFVHHYPIGVDLEKIRPNIEFEEIATHFFSKKEVEILLSLSPDNRQLGFFNCWTRKEAFIKAEGSGLSFPLDQFEVSLRPGETARLIATHWDPEEVSRWSLFSLDPADGFAGAVAIEGPIEHLTYWKWNE